MASPIEKVLIALEQAEVRYLIVGGVAVVLHGRLRTTADLDLWLALDAANLARALPALEAAGYRPPLEVDLFVRDPLDFDAAWSRGIVVALDETKARVVGLDDLIELKRRAGRPQDLEDVRVLKTFRGETDRG